MIWAGGYNYRKCIYCTPYQMVFFTLTWEGKSISIIFTLITIENTQYKYLNDFNNLINSMNDKKYDVRREKSIH